MGSKFMCGGVDQRDGSWRAVFQVHMPCNGGEHKGCVVLEERVSEPCADFDAAVALVKHIQSESGFDDWQPSGAKT